MSQHNSFGSGSASGSQRSVLKRYEKLEALQKKGLWDESKGCHSLPKVKVMRIKAKKEAKAAAPEAAAGAAGAKAAAPAAAKAAAPAAKDAKAKK
jgi:small basic protein (TIGR04137 family)